MQVVYPCCAFQEHFTIGEAFLQSDLKAQVDAVLEEDDQIPLDFAAHRSHKITDVVLYQ